MSGHFRATLFDEITCQSPSDIEDKFLHAQPRTTFVQRDLVNATGAEQRWASAISEIQAFDLDFRWDLIRLNDHRRNVFPIHGDAVAYGLSVALDARKADLKLRAFR